MAYGYKDIWNNISSDVKKKVVKNDDRINGRRDSCQNRKSYKYEAMCYFCYRLYCLSDLARMPKLKSYVGVLKFSTQCSERQDTTTTTTTLRLIAIVFKMAVPLSST